MTEEVVGSYHHPLLDIFWWNFKGRWITIAEEKDWPSWLALSFPSGAPGWWLEVHDYEWLWTSHLSDGEPDYWFCYYYREAAEHHLAGWIADKADTVARPLVDAVSNLLGSLSHGYSTFSSWLESIRDRVGTWIPSWSTSLADASSRLFYWLPESIRGNTSTWDELWEKIKSDVKEWSIAFYTDFVAWATNAWNWVLGAGALLKTWYDAVATWVTNFKNDPYGTVAGWLGLAWAFLVGAWEELQNFYNNVWIPFKVSLHDFLDHPVLWLYDRFDEEANNYIETLSRWVGKIAEKIIEWSWENT